MKPSGHRVPNSLAKVITRLAVMWRQLTRTETQPGLAVSTCMSSRQSLSLAALEARLVIVRGLKGAWIMLALDSDSKTGIQFSRRSPESFSELATKNTPAR